MMWRVAAGLSLVLVVAACGDDGDSTASTTTTSVASTTEAETTTTESSTTTTEAPTDEDQVRDAIDAFSTVFPDLGNPPSAESPALDLLVDPMRSRVTQKLPQMAAAGQFYEGEFEVDIDEITIDGGVAVARACGADAVRVTDASGADVLAADDPETDAKRYEFRLEQSDDRWKVAELSYREDEPCRLP